MRLGRWVGLWVVTFCSAVVADPPPRGMKTVALNGHHFTLPEGFTIELAAKTPLIDRPITAAFDDQGRLYVSDSSGSNERVTDQLHKKPHRIIRLEDTDGDGVYDRSTVFADRMMFPEGTLWHAGSLYVAAPPSIWKLTDTNNDGVADLREEWFKGETLTGCANDLHGPYLGLDGWIYWTKGAFAKQTYLREGKKPLVTRAAHIFRRHPKNHGEIEAVMTGGMDNPVDVVFARTGERFFTTTFFQHPEAGLRDGLIHAIYGGIYGKDHDPIYEHPWTSPQLLPVLTHFGPAAPAGLHCLEHSHWGKSYLGNLFAAQFNLRKVSRHVLVSDGSTYKTIDSDFLVSDHVDFHPTDVLEDADGSLLVFDTGGWYKLCCPTSQLVKPDVYGAIYRIRKIGTPRIDDPWGKKIAWSQLDLRQLALHLQDPRVPVRHRAMTELVQRGDTAFSSLLAQKPNLTLEGEVLLLWTAVRLGSAEAKRYIETQLAAPIETIRHAALHGASVLRLDANKVVPLLKDPSLAIRRAAAEAIGRVGTKAQVSAVLAALADPRNDRILDHSLTYALLEINEPSALDEGILSTNPRVRRAALVAKHYLAREQLQPQPVFEGLASDYRPLKETCLWLIGRESRWSNYFADYLRQRLTRTREKAEDAELLELMIRFAKTPAVQQLLAELVAEASRSPTPATLALQAMARSGVSQVPATWWNAIESVLKQPLEGLLGEAVSTARALAQVPNIPSTVVAALLTIGREPKHNDLIRLQALAALPPSAFPSDDSLFRYVLSRLDRDQPVAIRSTSAEVLVRSARTTEQLLKLADTLKTVAPMELGKLLDVFPRSTDDAVGLALITALNTPEVRASLRTEMIKPRLEKYSPKVREAAVPLYTALDAALAEQRSKLEALMPQLKEGNIRRGQLVFNSPKLACASCHKIGYVGGTVGPDLTRIGAIRSDRDLLEAIVFPSASFVRSYEPVLVVTRSGKQFNGILKKDAPEEVILAINATDVVRIRRDEIEEISPSNVSVMPAGLDQQLSPQELADLVAFLRACR